MTGLELRVNGIHSAWMAEFGHDCPHCDEIRETDPYRIANVSYSLVQRDPGGRLLRHTLIDAGLGVMQSLLDFEQSHGVHVVHEVLLSHSHFDHVGHLDWLGSSLKRNGRPDQPRPLPVYCTQPCWDMGPNRLFPWLVGGAIRHVPLTPGTAVELGAIRVTPMNVEHGRTAPGAVGLVIETTPALSDPRKIVLTCDLLSVPEPDHPAWHGADVCFIESNTWNPNPDTGHQRIQDALELLRSWRPKRTYLIHYSGFEDTLHPAAEVNRPLTRAELAQVVARHACDLDVRVARHGMMFPLDEPWPA